jgi:hypothetical protein
MATNPFRETEKASETGGLGGWLLRNAGPRTDPNATVHRLRRTAGPDRPKAAPRPGGSAANDPDAPGSGQPLFARRRARPVQREAVVPVPGGTFRRQPPQPRRPTPERYERLARGVVLALFAVMALLGIVVIVAALSPDPLPPTTAPEASATSPGGTPSAPVAPSSLAPAADITPRVSPEPVKPQPAKPELTEAPSAAVLPPRPAAPELPPPTRTIEAARPELAPAEIRALLARGDEMRRAGAVTSARPLLERATLAGDGTAALWLGQSYDPAFLAGGRPRGDAARNVGLAIFWYRRAQQLGNDTAGFLARKLETASRAQWSNATSPHAGRHRSERAWQP